MSNPANPTALPLLSHDVTIRAADAADMPGIRAIAIQHDILRDWPRRPDFLDLERQTGRLLIAHSHAGVLGFAGTLTRGTVTHLGDLFIHRQTQSAGLGARLLAAILPPTGQPVVTFASADPRALALYLRHGLLPRQPLWYLAGDPAALPVTTARLRRATVEQVADLDAELSGGDRHGHLTWYARQPGVAVWSTPGGYAFTRTDNNSLTIGPAGGRAPHASVDVVLAAADHARTRRLQVRLAVFGTHPAAAVLIRAGLRIVDQDTFMTSHDQLLSVERYLPNPDLG